MSAKDHEAWSAIKGSRMLRYAAATILENAAKHMREGNPRAALFLCCEVRRVFIEEKQPPHPGGWKDGTIPSV